MSIKKRIYYAVCAIIFIPFFIYFILSLHNIASVRYNTCTDMLNSYNEFAASEYNNYISINRSQVASIAGSYYAKQMIWYNNDKQNENYIAALQNVKKDDDLYSSDKSMGFLIVADKDGKVLYSTGNSLDNKNIAEQSYFKDTLQNRSIVKTRSDYMQNSDGIIFSCVVTDDEKNIIGVVIKNTDFSFLKNYFSKSKLYRSGFIFAIDNNGSIISTKNDILIPALSSENSEHPINKLIAEARSGKDISHYELKYNIDNKQVFAKATYLKDYDFFIISGVDNREIETAIIENINILLIIGILFAVLAFILSFFFSSKLLEPLKIINSAIEKNKISDQYVYMNYSAKNEFGIIAKTFNEMIDKIKRIQEKVKNDEINYYKALRGINDVVWEWSFADKQFSASDGWATMFGSPPPKIMTMKYLEDNILISEDSEKAITVINNQLNKKSPYYRITMRVKTADGTIKWIESKGLTYFDENGVAIKLLGSITDVSEYKEVQQKLFEIIYYDMLTGIRSKFKINKDLYETIEKHPKQSHCLIILDLDDIKDINDNYGHNIGDKIIKWVASSIEKRLGENDIVGRFGGDEFIILFSNVTDLNSPIQFIQNLRNEIKAGFQYKQTLLPVSFSSGISYYPQDANNAKNLLKYSDIALLEAKNSGKDKYMVFSKKMLEYRLRQNRIKLELAKAIENNELYVYYQPIYDTKTHKLRGAEALSRFNSKTMGQISPIEFIPISEQTGDIQNIGLYCLEQSCIMVNKLKELNIDIDFISVNLSIKQLYLKGFIKRIREVFDKTNADISKIKFEITESIFINSYNNVLDKITMLKEMGAQIALDDFGSGYSSLAHLGELPIDVIKIDKSFTDQIITNYKNYNVIALIIMLAERLGIQVVAEGVETKEQLDAYSELDCDMIQGYYFAKPMCDSDFLISAKNQPIKDVVEVV